MKKFCSILILFLTLLACRNENQARETDYLLSGMDLKTRVGQMIMVSIPGGTVSEIHSEILKLSRPGGIILFGYNLGSSRSISRFVEGLQDISMKRSGIPLFISIDQEGGRVRRIEKGVTLFPGNMASGSANNEKDVYLWGRIVGLELRSLGINMNLAPVLDVNNNPGNPVINIRSFGSDPGHVSRMGRSYIRGLQESNCIAVGKHFPGHGDTDRDSHLTLPVIPYDMERLERVELVPFRAALEEKVSGIMSAHISYPKLLEPGQSATLSKKILTDLLRKKMGFDGLIITDDMEMNAISKRYSLDEAAVRAVKAGADIVLISTHGRSIELIRDGILRAVREGRISRQRIDRSVKRILEAKLRYGIMDIDSAGNITRPSFRISRKDQSLLARAEKVNRRMSREALYYDGDPSLLGRRGVVYVRGSAARVFSGFSSLEVAQTRSDLDRILSGGKARVLYHVDSNAVNPDTASIQVSRRLAEMRKIPLVVVSTGNPFPVAGEGYPNVLYSFSNTPASLEALALALSGAVEPSRSIPFQLRKP